MAASRWASSTKAMVCAPGSRWMAMSGPRISPRLRRDTSLRELRHGRVNGRATTADDPTINTGEARVTVTLGNGPKATLALDDVPTLGTLQWGDMSVSDGRFSGSLTTQDSETYEAVGQFGGADQAGVVGHASGSDLQSVFYGQKAD